MKQSIFITGIGTDVGKTVVSAIVTEALQADYWKPVQAGFAEGTDAERVRALVSNPFTVVHDELYRLHTPASPHIAARMDGIAIDERTILQQAAALQQAAGDRPLVIEGAGGLLVPFSDTLFVADLVRSLQARLVIVSRNYLGSINHSLLTAAWCRAQQLDVAGWIFNDDYLSYEAEIVGWSGYPSLGSIPKLSGFDRGLIAAEAAKLSGTLQAVIA
ncbi:dethiobiotin synthase [Sediminibacterium soli]|uniref:dethiobiotin synthase n=1 Tax=Sediminibacterium soli TaxID=2698829 RepID=UPI00137A5BB1|nr:dethiobiotin synthase [Sediminibacterium soli]NCI46299.1 dethiobiotin synthase [Sediminibacterium soli]